MSFKPVLTIIRGLPGSGKTTLAKQIGQPFYEADQFFVGEDGFYRFDGSRIKEAHNWCMEEVKKSLQRGFPTVVSNTFTRVWEFEPYLKLGYPVRVIELTGKWESVHGIPQEHLFKMRDRWEHYHPGVFISGQQANCHPTLPEVHEEKV